MDAPWRLDPVRAEDRDAWAAMVRAFYATDPLLSAMDDDRARRQVDAALALPPGAVHVFLLRRGDDPAGYAFLVPYYSNEWGGRVVWIDELYIDGAFRGHGLGAKLVAELEVRARALGFKRLLLEVTDHCPAARLYTRLGFETLPRRLMTKPL